MDIEDHFRNKYPDLFGDLGDLIDFNCGGGWMGIIDQVCKKITNKGVKFYQLKEKFGTLRIYVDINSRIEFVGEKGVKDGKFTELDEPDADVVIVFRDSRKALVSDRFLPLLLYCPSSDKFLSCWDNHPDEFNHFGKFSYDKSNENIVKAVLSHFTDLISFDFDQNKESIDETLQWAEDESRKVCESCGSRENVKIEGSWVKTLCVKCRDKPDWWKK